MVVWAQPSRPSVAGLSKKGQAVYKNYCIGCHLASGQGTPPAIPPLTGNARMRDLRYVVQTVRQGRGVMPAFSQLDAAEIQAVTTYVQNAWGDRSAPVEHAQVTALITELDRDKNLSTAAAAGWYTEKQAEEGKGEYVERCGRCHGVNFVPDDFATGLTGAAFEWRWKNRTVFDLFETTRNTMPPGEEGTLGPEMTLRIVAYILKSNGFKAGPKELTPDPELLRTFRLAR